MADNASVTVGIVQAAAVIGDIDGNLRTLRQGVNAAAELGAQVVVTPELFATGYDPRAAWTHDGNAIRDEISVAARDAGVAVVASTVEERSDAAGQRRHIAASFFDEAGDEIARIRKRHLFDIERNYFTPADGYSEVFEWRGMRFGMGICYDVEFPEFVRTLAVNGAQILLVPTAVPKSPDGGGALAFSASQSSTLLVPARALENGVAIAYANHCADAFTAHSCIVNANGRFVDLIEDGAGIAVAEISATSIAEARALNPYLTDLERLLG